MEKILHGAPLLTATPSSSLTPPSQSIPAGSADISTASSANASSIKIWAAQSIGITLGWIHRTNHFSILRREPSSSSAPNASSGCKGTKDVQPWDVGASNSSAMSVEESHVHMGHAQRIKITHFLLAGTTLDPFISLNKLLLYSLISLLMSVCIMESLVRGCIFWRM